MLKKTMFTAFTVACAVAFGVYLTYSENMLSAAKKEDSVRHIVLIAFKDGTPSDTIAEIMDAAVKLQDEIGEVETMEWGTEIAVTPRADGFTHCLNMEFRNRADLETYLPHPAHEAFKARAIPHVEKLLVFDYVPNQ